MKKILAGEKTWEIRSRPNSRAGRIALCEKGGPIVAIANIGKSIAISANDFSKHFDKHCVTMEQLRKFYGDRPVVYAWPITDVSKRPFDLYVGIPIQARIRVKGLRIQLSAVRNIRLTSHYLRAMSMRDGSVLSYGTDECEG